MSIRHVPQLYRIYCDLQSSPSCLKFSKELSLSEMAAESLVGAKGSGEAWIRLGPEERAEGGHGCRECVEAMPPSTKSAGD
jgi:hypothetical protein